MRASRNIYAPNLNLEHLAQALAAWYRTEQFGVERSDISKGTVQLRCRRSNNNNKSKPNLLVTMRQQDSGLNVDIEVHKRGRLMPISALIFFAIVALLGLAAGSSGLFLLAIAVCAFCVLSLSRKSKMPARTFTVIEQFVTAPNSINPPVLQPGNHGFTGGQMQKWSLSAQPSNRDEPIGLLAPNTADGLVDAGVITARPQQSSARDEPIEPSAPNTSSNDSPTPIDELVPSGFSHKGATGTTAPEIGAADRACSCGEMNPPNANFCVGCGKTITGPV